MSCDIVLAYKRKAQFNSMQRISGHSQVSFQHKNTHNILTEGGYAKEMVGQLH